MITHTVTVVRQYLAPVFLLVIGLIASGCGDKATVTPAAELASLTVSPGTLQPAFNSGTTQYNVDLSNNVTRVTITAQPASGGTVTINGQATSSSVITLGAAGTPTPVSIVVSEPGINPSTYTVFLNRATLAGNNSLQNLTVSPGTLAPPFNADTTNYTVNLPAGLASNVTSVTVTPTLQATTASMTVNGQPATSGQGHATPLPGPGSNTFINIVVTAQNNTQKTYSVNVIRAALGGNNNLQNLTVSPGSLAPAFDANTTNYTVDVASSVTSVTVTPTLQDTTASMTVNGQATTSGQDRSIPLNGAGSNTAINIVVTAPNGNQKIYTATVIRAAPSSNNNLRALTVSPGTLAPAFDSNTTAYTVDVTSGIASVTVTATPADTSASMTINGQGTSSGQASSINLGAQGSSTNVTIVVTAPNGNLKTYTIAVNRAAPSSDNNLSALTVEGSLVPGFAPSTTVYMVGVPANVASVTVSATKSDSNAILSGSIADPGAGQTTGQAIIPLGGPGTATPVTITVTAPNGASKAYAITITRALL